MDPSIKNPETYLDEDILEYASLVLKQLVLSLEPVELALQPGLRSLEAVAAIEKDKMPWQVKYLALWHTQILGRRD